MNLPALRHLIFKTSVGKFSVFSVIAAGLTILANTLDITDTLFPKESEPVTNQTTTNNYFGNVTHDNSNNNDLSTTNNTGNNYNNNSPNNNVTKHNAEENNSIIFENPNRLREPEKADEKSNINQRTISTPIEPRKVIYFNENVIIADQNKIALFIKDSNNQLESKMARSLSNYLLEKNIKSSTSFFNYSSLSFFDEFWSADTIWNNKTNISQYANQYIIGTLEKDIRASSEDNSLNVISMVFTGRLINIQDNITIPIQVSASRSNFVKSKGMNSVYEDISKKVYTTLYK